MLEFEAELAIPAEVNGAKNSRPSFIVVYTIF
jgi:hypothetical protein